MRKGRAGALGINSSSYHRIRRFPQNAYVNYDNAIFRGEGSISGGITTLPGSSLTCNLPDGVVKLDGSHNLIFGFAENRTYDAVLEDVQAPEPGSLILLGTGLLGWVHLAGKSCGRKACFSFSVVRLEALARSYDLAGAFSIPMNAA